MNPAALRAKTWLCITLALLIATMAPAGALAQATPAMTKRFTIGVLPNVSARLILASYQPMRAYFERELGVPVDIATGTQFQDFSDRMLKGEYDLAITAPNLGRVAQLDAKWDLLAIYEPKIPALVVAMASNTEDRPDQVRGKSVAMANPQSLVALIAKRWLAERNLVAERDFKVLVAANDDSLGAVLNSGEAPWAVMSMGEFRAKPEELRKTLRIVHRIAEVPGFYVMANPTLDPAKREQLKKLILAFPRSAEAPDFFRLSGFTKIREVEASDISFLDPYLDATRQGLGLKR